MDADSFGRRQILFWAIVVEGGLIVAALGFGWWCEVPPGRYIVLDLPAVGRGLLLTLPMVVSFFVLVYWPVGPLGKIKTFSEDVLAPIFAQCTLADLALISLLAGVGEEMFFRAFLQPLVGQWLGVWAGIVLVSLLFGLVHFITLTYAVLAALAGLYLGVAVHYSGNVFDAILAHALYDFVGLLWLARTKPCVPEFGMATDQSEEVKSQSAEDAT